MLSHRTIACPRSYPYRGNHGANFGYREFVAGCLRYRRFCETWDLAWDSGPRFSNNARVQYGALRDWALDFLARPSTRPWA